MVSNKSLRGWGVFTSTSGLICISFAMLLMLLKPVLIDKISFEAWIFRSTMIAAAFGITSGILVVLYKNPKGEVENNNFDQK